MAEDLKMDAPDGGADEKLYTQAELDEKLKDIPSEEELTAFRNWKESQQSESEKAAKREKEYEAAKAELARIKAEQKVMKSEAKPEFAEFVASKINAMDGDFDKNLVKFKEENPQYFGETVIKRVTSSASMSGGEKKTETTNDIMNNIIRNHGIRG